MELGESRGLGHSGQFFHPKTVDSKFWKRRKLDMTSKMDSNARFTLGARAKKTWGQLWAFLGCKLTPKLLINATTLTSGYPNKCYNTDVRILINAGILAPRIANCLLFSLLNIFPNWPPKFDVILFPALGPIQGHKVQHLVVTWGILKSFFFYFSLDF
jgi:hypothetical protein